MERNNSNSIENLMRSPESVITDAGNQFYQFQYFDIDTIKNLVPTANLKTLEDYIINKNYYNEDTSKVIERIKKSKPMVFGEYNNLIERLKSPTLTKEEFLKILKDSKNLI